MSMFYFNNIYSYTVTLIEPKPCYNNPSYMHYPDNMLKCEFYIYGGLLGDTSTYQYRIYLEQNGSSVLMDENLVQGTQTVTVYINLQNFNGLCHNERAFLKLNVRQYHIQPYFNTTYGFFVSYKHGKSCNYYSLNQGSHELLNQEFIPITIFGTCGGLASGIYFVKRWKTTFTINGNFRDSMPKPENSLCLGYSGAGPNNQERWAYTVESAESMVRIITFTYEVYDILGRHLGYYPCRKEKATIVYDYIQRPVISELSNYPQNPSPVNPVSYVQCNLSNGSGNLNYEWRDSNTTRFNVRLTPLPGNRAYFEVFFNSFNKDIRAEDSAYYYFVRVSNEMYSTDWIRKKVRFNLLPTGCPEVFFYEGKDLLNENAILIKSKSAYNKITDNMILMNPFLKHQGEIKMLIKENNEDKTSLDMVKLYKIRTNTGLAAAVTDEGDVISFNPEEGKTKVIRNGHEDISISVDKEDENVIEIKKDDKLTVISETGKGNYLILDLFAPYNKYDKAGVVTSGESLYKDFFTRDNQNRVCINLQTSEPGEVQILASQDFTVDRILVVNRNELKSISELNIKSAIDLSMNDVSGIIKDPDNESAIISSSNSIFVTFDNAEPSPDDNAFYLLKTNGQILQDAVPGKISEVMQRVNIETNKLHENSPNPFNPSTKIKFSIAKDGIVKLSVFDITGRKIREIKNGFLIQGEYEVIFDGNGLSSGFYFYKLEADGFVQTKRMILLK